MTKKDATISIASAAVLYGLSVYTVIPVSIGSNGDRLAFRMGEHYNRLLDSVNIMGIDSLESSWNYEKFEEVVVNLLKANEVNEDVYVRVSVHVDEQLAGTRSRGVHTTLSMFIYDALPNTES